MERGGWEEGGREGIRPIRDARRYRKIVRCGELPDPRRFSARNAIAGSPARHTINVSRKGQRWRTTGRTTFDDESTCCESREYRVESARIRARRRETARNVRARPHVLTRSEVGRADSRFSIPPWRSRLLPPRGAQKKKKETWTGTYT